MLKVFQGSHKGSITSTKESGSGIGLIVVKRILKEHHGTMEVSSFEGLGTTFTLIFPIKVQEEIKETPQPQFQLLS
ncbi:MAG: hypothetical protein HRT90_07850, partial [Candidatus Margulisbacteria bacterium]|nr:hypothetical protein [Candidatus Margulisiibacteriota bacterium]